MAVYNSKLKPLYTAYLHSIKLSGYGIEIKFDKDPLAVEQKNYLTKFVNVYIVSELDAQPSNPSNNFKFKNCLFGATSIEKKYGYRKSMCILASNPTDNFKFKNYLFGATSIEKKYS